MTPAEDMEVLVPAPVLKPQKVTIKHETIVQPSADVTVEPATVTSASETTKTAPSQVIEKTVYVPVEVDALEKQAREKAEAMFLAKYPNMRPSVETLASWTAQIKAGLRKPAK